MILKKLYNLFIPTEAGREPPQFGKVRFGDFRRLKPISENWGFDRGSPLDRYYIENFLYNNESLIKGNVLEIGDNNYTKEYGGEKVQKSDVLNLDESDPRTTIIADLTHAPNIPDNVFDCIICTQTLQFIFDVRSAVRTLFRILKPGGVLLVTVSGISKTSDTVWGDYWCWNFTPHSVKRLFEEFFHPNDLMIHGQGNILVAVSFLQGIAAGELDKNELDYYERGYDILITTRAIKRETPP
jgi:SAM-dependent methyltransferase